jgi:hypothetical protein
MAVDKTYKNGGSGKGQAVRLGLNLSRYGSNLEKTHGTRSSKCLDCKYFAGINSIDVVTCLPDKKHKGLDICSDFKEKS